MTRPADILPFPPMGPARHGTDAGGIRPGPDGREGIERPGGFRRNDEAGDGEEPRGEEAGTADRESNKPLNPTHRYLVAEAFGIRVELEGEIGAETLVVYQEDIEQLRMGGPDAHAALAHITLFSADEVRAAYALGFVSGAQMMNERSGDAGEDGK